jgi:hypothetical protein
VSHQQVESAREKNMVIIKSATTTKQQQDNYYYKKIVPIFCLPFFRRALIFEEVLTS